MLQILEGAERYLLTNNLLCSGAGWCTKYIDYHPPLVERLYRQWGEYRISLHRIHPCTREEALLHPHPWPAAFRVYGEYELGFGYSETNERPPVTHKMVTTCGFAYEMTHRHAWHYVAPTKGPVLTLMVNGPSWGRQAPLTTNKDFRKLTPEEVQENLKEFRALIV